jgi:hypothetical protein
VVSTCRFKPAFTSFIVLVLIAAGSVQQSGRSVALVAVDVQAQSVATSQYTSRQSSVSRAVMWLPLRKTFAQGPRCYVSWYPCLELGNRKPPQPLLAGAVAVLWMVARLATDSYGQSDDKVPGQDGIHSFCVSSCTEYV